MRAFPRASKKNLFNQAGQRKEREKKTPTVSCSGSAQSTSPLISPSSYITFILCLLHMFLEYESTVEFEKGPNRLNVFISDRCRAPAQKRQASVWIPEGRVQQCPAKVV